MNFRPIHCLERVARGESTQILEFCPRGSPFMRMICANVASTFSLNVRTDCMDRMESPKPDFRDSITVITGLPRSGTSLMMQMLEAAGVPILCDDERKRDASNPNGYYELAAVKATARDTSWVARAPGYAVKVIHALVPVLPRDRSYRVILMLRDLAEVIDSQARMLAARGQPAGKLPEARLAEIFAAQLDETRHTLEAGACFDWIEVQHGNLIEDGRVVAQRVSQFLGLCDPGSSPDTARIKAMGAVVDPALYRARKQT